MRRKGGVYVMELEGVNMVGEEEETRDSADVGGVSSGGKTKKGEGLVFMARLDEKDMGVFRRQAQTRKRGHVVRPTMVRKRWG